MEEFNAFIVWDAEGDWLVIGFLFLHSGGEEYIYVVVVCCDPVDCGMGREGNDCFVPLVSLLVCHCVGVDEAGREGHMYPCRLLAVYSILCFHAIFLIFYYVLASFFMDLDRVVGVRLYAAVFGSCGDSRGQVMFADFLPLGFP